MYPRIRSIFKEHHLLGLILLVTLLNGLAYVFLVPPWQHYDEPTNFEYAWLFANRPGIPQPGDYDASMRRQVAESMSKHNFYGRGNSGPDLTSIEDPVPIGISQIGDQPFAYWAASTPMRLMKTRSVTNQLYAGRMVSLIFYLVVVLSAWGIMREIVPPGRPLRWVVPLSLALFPGLANLMAALNNDAAAVAVFSLFLWGSVRILQRGISWAGAAWVAGAAVLGYFTKITTYVALPLLPVVLVLGKLNGQRKVWTYGVLSSGVLVVLFSFFSLGDAAAWYRSTVQQTPTRSESRKAVTGRYVFRLEAGASSFPSAHRPLFQPILKEYIPEMKGKIVTLGAWIWATQAGETTTPILGDGVKNYSQKVTITTEPAFYAFRARVDEKSFRAYVLLPGNITPKDQDISIYYDNVVLAVGEWPINTAPVLNENSQDGYWGEMPFVNLLRNSSAEAGTIRAQAWLDTLLSKYASYYSGPSFNLHYLLDLNNVYWHFRMSSYRMFTTFWGQFGWGHVPLLLGSRPYRNLGILCVLAVLGAILFTIRNRKSFPWVYFLIFGLSIFGIWGMAFFRGTSHLSVPWFYLPVARYGYPAIIPTMLIFGVGIIELLRAGTSLLRLPQNSSYFLYLASMLALNIISIYSIARFYYL